jgi:hypothetical protein
MQGFSKSCISESFAATLQSQLELTGLDSVKVGEENIKPLGKMRIYLRWKDKGKWLSIRVMVLPDAHFTPLSFDIAFSFEDDVRLTSRYPELWVSDG